MERKASMAEYLLTIRVKMEAVDNLDARVKVKEYLNRVYGTSDFTNRTEEEVKVQKLNPGKAPEKVEL